MIITKINELDGGWEIVTPSQSVVMQISTVQACCENWGYITSEDDLQSFIGAELLSVTITDTKLETIDLRQYASAEVEAIFVNVYTTAGMIQFVLYNDHNGYYSHHVKVSSLSLNYEDYI